MPSCTGNGSAVRLVHVRQPPEGKSEKTKFNAGDWNLHVVYLSRRSPTGKTLSVWVLQPAALLLRKHALSNKYDDLVEEVDLVRRIQRMRIFGPKMVRRKVFHYTILRQARTSNPPYVMAISGKTTQVETQSVVSRSCEWCW